MQCFIVWNVRKGRVAVAKPAGLEPRLGRNRFYQMSCLHVLK